MHLLIDAQQRDGGKVRPDLEGDVRTASEANRKNTAKGGLRDPQSCKDFYRCIWQIG